MFLPMGKTLRACCQPLAWKRQAIVIPCMFHSEDGVDACNANQIQECTYRTRRSLTCLQTRKKLQHISSSCVSSAMKKRWKNALAANSHGCAVCHNMFDASGHQICWSFTNKCHATLCVPTAWTKVIPATSMKATPVKSVNQFSEAWNSVMPHCAEFKEAKQLTKCLHGLPDETTMCGLPCGIWQELIVRHRTPPSRQQKFNKCLQDLSCKGVLSRGRKHLHMSKVQTAIGMQEIQLRNGKKIKYCSQPTLECKRCTLQVANLLKELQSK